MSRAFVDEDGGGAGPLRDYGLPSRDSPYYDAVAADVLLEAARAGETGSAEQATGYYWGEPALRSYVEQIRLRARAAGDGRLEQLADRFLR